MVHQLRSGCRLTSPPVELSWHAHTRAHPHLQEYVRNRLLQFIRGFGTRVLQLAPDLHPTLVDRAVRDVLEVLPQPDYGLVPVDMLELQLVFRHDCM